nr:hypothetical protein [Mycobacterium sp. E3298]
MTSTIKVILSANPIKEWAKEQVQEYIKGALEAVGVVLVEASYSIALLGGGISAILWVAGWKQGARYSGILLVAHVLIKVLLGGT